MTFKLDDQGRDYTTELDELHDIIARLEKFSAKFDLADDSMDFLNGALSEVSDDIETALEHLQLLQDGEPVESDDEDDLTRESMIDQAINQMISDLVKTSANASPATVLWTRRPLQNVSISDLLRASANASPARQNDTN